MHYFLPLVSRCFTALGRWSGTKNIISEMLARTILEQRNEGPLVDWHGKRWSTVWMKFTLQNSNWRTKSCTRAMEPSPKNIQQADERGKEVGFLWKSYEETIIDRGVSVDRRHQRLNRHRNSNSKKQRLTAKLNNRNRSYEQNNRNRKVNSKWWKLWWFSSIFECCEKLLTVNKWSAIEVFVDVV